MPHSSSDTDFTVVMRTAEPDAIDLARSLLEAAQLRYLARGDGPGDLFGLGRRDAAQSPPTGPVTFLVASEDAAAARLLLADLLESAAGEA